MAKRSVTPPATVLPTEEVDLNVPRSDLPGDVSETQPQPDLTVVPASTATRKRGRGRPAKSKSDSEQNGPVSGPANKAQRTDKPTGRSLRKKEASVASQAFPIATDVKSRRGRPKKSDSVSVIASPPNADGSRKRGRPKKADVGDAAVPASTATTVASATRRSGRRLRTGGVAVSTRKTRKVSSLATKVSGNEVADQKERKKNNKRLLAKVKEGLNKLKAAVALFEEVQVIVAGMES